MNFYLALLFFMCGIGCYIFTEKVLQTKKVVALFGHVNYCSIELTSWIEDQIYKNYKDKLTQSDIETMEMFQTHVVDAFRVIYPKELHKFIPFKTWKEALAWKRKHEKAS